jgi:hypothetical protein
LIKRQREKKVIKRREKVKPRAKKRETEIREKRKSERNDDINFLHRIALHQFFSTALSLSKLVDEEKEE